MDRSGADLGLRDFFSRNKRQKQVRSLISTYYGGDWKYFVWNYANQIYDIPEVRTAIEKISDIFSSMPIYHKRINKDDSVEYLQDTTHRVLNYYPNPLQNGTQFIKNIVTQLLVESNAFAEPIFDYQTGRLLQIYPIPNKVFKFETDNGNRNAYVLFADGTNPEKKYNLKDIIYLSRFCTLSGGKKNNLGLYETVLKSLGEQIVNVASPKKPRAILQSNQVGQGQLKDKDRKGTMEDVKANFDESVQGLVYFDKMWNITPINWQENDVNRELMQMVINIVYNYFSINENIINNKASEVEMEMFINTTIKPLAIQFEKEFTNKLFTENEYYFGNRIEFDYYSLSVSTLQAKTSLFGVAIRQGILNIDECREMIGQPPLPNGWGKKYRVTADTVDIEIANKYQLGKVNQTEKVSTTESTPVEDIKSNKEVSSGEGE